MKTIRKAAFPILLILADAAVHFWQHAIASLPYLPLNGVVPLSILTPSLLILSFFATFALMKQSHTLKPIRRSFLSAAAMLAFLVLFNLTNINVTERIRELATLKVLGFYDMETASYVYRENIILTLIGAMIGMAVGKGLHRWLIGTIEVDYLIFGRGLHVRSYLYAVLLTAVFSLSVNFFSFFSIQKIDMVESLKSVE